MHDGVLQALALVDRRDLDGGGIAVEATNALGGGVRALGPQPLQQTGQTEGLPPRGLVQRLGEMTQVGQLALTPDPAEHACGEPALLGGLEQRGHATAAQEQGPATQPVGQLVGELLAAGVQLAQGAAEERREGGGPDPSGPLRLLQGLEEAQPLVTGR